MEHLFDVNTILHTKDGSKIGNAIVVGRDGYYWIVKTDYGNSVRFTREEIDRLYNVAWYHFTVDNDGLDCDQMQKMMQSDHKNRVNL